MTSLGKLFTRDGEYRGRKCVRNRAGVDAPTPLPPPVAHFRLALAAPRDLIFNNIVIKTCGNEPGRWDVNFVYGRSQS